MSEDAESSQDDDDDDESVISRVYPYRVRVHFGGYIFVPRRERSFVVLSTGIDDAIEDAKSRWRHREVNTPDDEVRRIMGPLYNTPFSEGKGHFVVEEVDVITAARFGHINFWEKVHCDAVLKQVGDGLDRTKRIRSAFLFDARISFLADGKWGRLGRDSWDPSLCIASDASTLVHYLESTIEEANQKPKGSEHSRWFDAVKVRGAARVGKIDYVSDAAAKILAAYDDR